MKLLLVEDDTTTVESVKLCFEINDPETKIIFTGKGTDALRMLKFDQYDGVILDLGLPDIDGMEVLTELRSYSKMPVIILSARHSLNIIARATELGANDYVAKPFDYKLLVKRVKNVIENSLRT